MDLPTTRRRGISRFVDPVDGLTEVLFGLIMVSTFTVGAGLIIGDGPDAVHELLLAIVGCNVAWGFIDGCLYLLSCLLEQSRKARLLDAIRRTESPEAAVTAIARVLDPELEPMTTADDRQRLYEAIHERLKDAAPERTRIEKADIRGALALFVITVLCTLPAVVPLLVIPDRFVALRVSNALVLVALFAVGFRWARATHGRPWLFGGALLALGLLMVGVAIALGG